jgi:hypothetical protein
MFIIYLLLFFFNELEWLMVENIESICYLLNKDYNLFTQGNKWLYFFHYILQTIKKCKGSY